MRNYKIETGRAIDIGMAAQELIGKIERLRGFRAYYLFEASEDRIASIGLFDTEAGGKESDQLAEDWVREHFDGFRLTPVEITEGDVLASSQRARGDG